MATSGSRISDGDRYMPWKELSYCSVDPCASISAAYSWFLPEPMPLTRCEWWWGCGFVFEPLQRLQHCGYGVLLFFALHGKVRVPCVDLETWKLCETGQKIESERQSCIRYKSLLVCQITEFNTTCTQWRSRRWMSAKRLSLRLGK